MPYNSQYSLQFDGLYRALEQAGGVSARPGFMCYGWLIFQDDRFIARGYGAFAHGKRAASNLAEYLALIEGLEALADLGVQDEPVEVFGDAKCVIDQMKGIATVSSMPTQSFYRRAKRLAGVFEHIRFKWVPRKRNRGADQLTRLAMQQVQIDPAAYSDAVQAMTAPGGRSKSNRLLPLVDLRVYQR